MDVKASQHDSNNHNEQLLPLLNNMEVVELGTEETEKNLIYRAMSQTFKSTAHLANFLPTGTVLSFQLVSPIFTNQGNCDPVFKFMTLSLLALCGASCFFLCFTDSFRDSKGNVCYGIIDGSASLPHELVEKYQLRFIDFVHAAMSILVFAAIALFDENVVKCFFPSPSHEMHEILTAVPLGVAVLCSMLFVVFPTQRHGIGFPLSTN